MFVQDNFHLENLVPQVRSGAVWPVIATGMTHRNSPGVVIGHRQGVAKLDWMRRISTCA